MIAASFFVLALVVMSAPAGQAGAQKSGENVVRSGSIAVSGATSVVRGRTADVTVTTSALSAALLNSYYVRVTSNAVVDNNSGCSNGGVWTINPTQQTETTTISVYGCSIGDGVITGELWFSGPDGFDSKVRSDDHDIEVTATAVTTPVSTPAPRVSITAGSSIIIEGTDATFTIGVRGDFTGSLDVSIDVTGGSSFIEGTPPNTVIIQSGSTSETLTIETERDELDEPDATITVYLEDGDDYDLVSGSSSASVTVRDDDLSRPGRPTGLRVTRSDSGPADGTVTVSWNRSSDASDYRVQRGTSRYSNYSLVDSRTQNRISVELEAPCGTTYYFRVAADGKENVAEGWGSYSSGVVAPTCPPGPTIDSITALANLGRGTVQVDWTSRYRSLGEKMQRGTERNGVISYVSAPFQGGEPNRAKQVHEGIYTAPCGQLQYFRVAYQIRSSENHPYSNRWSAYSSPRTAPLCTAPAPTRLTVGSRTPYSATLTWRSQQGVSAYKIERSLNGANIWITVSTTISSSATSYTVGGLTCGKAYDYRISAHGDGQSYLNRFGGPSRILAVSGDGDSACPVLTIERPKDSSSNTIYRIFEDTDATFVVKADKAVNRSVTVRISVADEGNVVSGTKPTAFPFPANSTTATLTVDTDDDTRTDGAGSITVTLLDTTTRNDYNLGSDTSTSLIIDDDDLPLPPAPGGVSIQRVYGHDVSLIRFSHNSVTGARNYVVQMGTSSDPNHRSFRTVRPYQQTQPDGASRSLFTSEVYTASCDTTTYFRVAVEGDGETWRWARGEFTTPAATPPCHAPAPNDFAVDDSLTTDSTLTMSWTHEPGVTQYKIERWLIGNTYDNDVIEINHVAGTDNVSYEITGLACGTTFRYAISAKGDGVDDTNQGLPWYPDLYGTRSGNARGTTDACRVVSISTPMPTATPAPAHPQSDHRIFEGNAATFILTADEEFGAETIINITVSTSKASIAGTTPTQVTFAADSDTHTLTLNTLDYTTEQGRGSITVAVATPHPTAIPSYTVSANSGTATLTVDDDDLDLPDAPENLSVTAVTDTYTTQDFPVAISYDAVAGAASYQVERRLQGATAWDYIDTSRTLTVTCATTYEFQVKAFGNGEARRADLSAPSSIVTVTFDCPLAPAPSGLSVSSTEKYALTLRWSSVPDTAFYKLEREGANANEWVSAGVGADEITGVTHTVTGLQCGTSYSFQISANGDGYPYSTTFGEPSATLPVQETDDCPIVSVNIPSFIPTSSSPVRQYRIFEGGEAVFTLTTAEQFPLAVPVRIGVTHTGVGITDAILATITFPANSDTTTLQFATIDNNSDPDDVDNSDDGRKLITVTIGNGAGYRVSSTDGSSYIPVDDNDLDPAPAPQNITIASTQNYPTSVRIDWTRGTNISRYRVEKRLPQSSNPAEQRWTSAGSYTILGRTVGVDASTTCGLPHEYRVIPVGDGEVYLLDAGTASVTLSYTGGCPAANAPTGLMNTATTEYSVSLGWNSVTGAEFYKIERSADGQTGWAVVSAQDDTVAAPATKHTVTGLACGTGHYFRVSARGDGTPRLATYGTVSATLGPVTTNACPTVSIAPGTTPIVEGSDVTFTISLDPDVAVELPISITASQQGNFVATATPTPVPVPANSETYALTIATIDNTVGEPRGSYTVTLQANDDLYSIDPDASSATVTIDDDDLPPALPPADVTVVPVTTTPTFYRAEWTRANNVDRYEVEYRIPGETPWTSFGAYTIRVSVGVPNSLLCGKTYEFQVRAKGDGITTLARYGDWLNPPLSFTSHDCLAVPAPTNLAASNQGLMSIDFSWSPVTGAIEYKLEHRVKETNTWEEVLIDAPGVLPNAVTPTSTTNPSKTLSSLVCRTNYSVRVSARGNGRLYSSNFGDPTTDLETSTERSYTTCADRIPTFGSETISELRLTVDAAMTAVTLPEATGGDSPLTYSVSPDLPAGLMFDDDDRQITGTPSVTSCGASYIYTVTDADATDADTDTISFNIAVLSGENARPTFNNATVADWTYSVTTNSTALQLPQAVGGFGPLRYSIHPTGNTSGSLPAGLTFNANRLLIYGVPTSTAAATEYTFTVRNRADCASTDSDSITFDISIPDAPSLPATPTSVTGLSATADNDAGTITISWSANNYPGYQIRQYVSPRLLYPGLPRENYVITCGGKLATICPADSTSAVISGYSATGWYYILVSGHNGRSVSTASAYVSTGSVRLTAVSDPEPTFGTATAADMVLLEDTHMTPVTLPIAVGGNGQLDYTLTPDLPDGLSFNPLTRTISGTPKEAFPANTYTLTVTDSDSTNPDTETLTFMLSVIHDFTPNDPLPLGGESDIWLVPTSISSIYVDVQFSSGSQLDGRGAIRVERVTASGQAVFGSLLIRAVSHSQQLPSSFGSGEHMRISVDLDATTTTDRQVDLVFRSGSSTGPVIARASIIPYNRPPTFTGTPYSFTPLESTALGTVVARVSATDPEGQQITYSFVSGNNNDRFAIGPSTGLVTLQKHFDHETAENHTLLVRAEDPEGNAPEIPVDFTVTNVNEISIGDAAAVLEPKGLTSDTLFNRTIMAFPVSIEPDIVPATGLTLCYQTHGTATDTDDFVDRASTDGRLLLSSTTTSAEISFEIKKDDAKEVLETLTVKLAGVGSNCDSATLISVGNGTASGIIVDRHDIGPIGDNDTSDPIETSSEATQIVLTFKLDISSFNLFTDFEDRPFIISVHARDGVPQSALIPVSVVGAATLNESDFDGELPLMAFTSALNEYEDHGPGSAAYVEVHMPPSERYIELVLAKPVSLTGVVTYEITFSKPNIALLNSSWDISGEDGTLAVAVEVHNVESGSSDDAKYRIQTGCYLEGFPNDKLGREFPFDRLRGEDSHFLSSGATPKPLDIGILCQGAALQSGTSADRISQLRVELYYDPDGLSEFSDGDERVQSIAYPHTGTFEWPFTADDTNWHNQFALNNSILGGLQIHATQSLDDSPSCTLSFGINTFDPDPDEDDTSTPSQTVSTTAHCVTPGAPWRQGGWTSTSKTSGFQTIGQELWVPTYSNLDECQTEIGSTIENCVRADHAYATAASNGTYSNNGILQLGEETLSDVASLLKPLIEQFENSNQTFTIVKARPPLASDMFHKVGKSTGWTSGMVPRSILLGSPPSSSCLGGTQNMSLRNPAQSSLPVYNIECRTQATYLSALGDSGSPVFVRTEESSDDVILVGVHNARPDGYAAFVPIDRIYAESLMAGMDWTPDTLRPLPELDLEGKAPLERSETQIVAHFIEDDFSNAYNMRYEATLLRRASDTSSFEQVNDPNLATVSRTMPMATFDFSRVLENYRNGTITVGVRMCVQQIGNNNNYCGTFRPGRMNLTPIPAPTIKDAETSVSEGTPTVTWKIVAGADKYRLEYLTNEAEASWIEVISTPAITSSSASIRFTCPSQSSITASFRVSAYDEGWGFWSDVSEELTFTCFADSSQSSARSEASATSSRHNLPNESRFRFNTAGSWALEVPRVANDGPALEIERGVYGDVPGYFPAREVTYAIGTVSAADFTFPVREQPT